MNGSKARRRRHRKQSAANTGAESRASEAVTVGWMLTSWATLLAVFVWLALRTLAPQEGRLAIVGDLLLFAGSVTGLLALLLLPVVYRVRRDRPPRSIVAAATGIGVAPLLIQVVRIWLAGR